MEGLLGLFFANIATRSPLKVVRWGVSSSVSRLILPRRGKKTAADPKVGGCVKNTGWRLNQPVQPKSEMAVSRSLTS
jgi:hypothetical protein